MRAFLFLALLLLVFALPTLAQPKLPPLTGRVVDLADVLSSAQEAALTEQLAAHEAATSNQVVVATVPSLQGYDVERFAVDLYRAWGLGRNNRDNGVLLLVAPSEREARIEVGYGLEGTLTDALSSDIVHSRILPRFRVGDLPGGITSGVDGILSVIQDAYEPIPAPPEDPLQSIAPFLIILAWIVLVMILNSRRMRRRRVWGPILPGGWIGGGGFGGRDGGFGGGSFGGRGGGGFSGGGGRSGGGGASGRW